jgi:hypothetical protein
MYWLSFLLACLLASAGWLVYTGYCLFANYWIIRNIGLPLRVVPISPENPLWMIVDKKVFIPIFERSPFGTGSFTRYNWRGWEFKDKAQSHLEMGDAFVLITPGRNWFYLCNAEALADVFHRRVDFPRPLEIFGLGNHLAFCCCLANKCRNGQYLWSESLNGASILPIHHV